MACREGQLRDQIGRVKARPACSQGSEEKKLVENLAVSGIHSKIVQDSLSAGPELLNLRSLNLWRVLAPLQIGSK